MMKYVTHNTSCPDGVSLPRRYAAAGLVAGSVVCPLMLLIGLAVSCPVVRASSTHPEAQFMGQARIDPQLGDRIPLDLAFQNASGEAVQLKQIFGSRPVILHLVYYECPMLCKLSADGLLEGLERLDLDVGADFDVITLSFDPREGTALAARARRFALERYDRSTASGGWHFLTGDAESVQRLTAAVGFRAVWDESTGQYAHPSGVFVLTADGMISRYLSGIEFRPRDLRLAAVEASQGRLGSVSDQLLMLCYQYDPTTGRYGLEIMTAMRASGALTVAVLATAIVAMIRRERRKRTADHAASSAVDQPRAH